MDFKLPKKLESKITNHRDAIPLKILLGRYNLSCEDIAPLVKSKQLTLFALIDPNTELRVYVESTHKDFEYGNYSNRKLTNLGIKIGVLEHGGPGYQNIGKRITHNGYIEIPDTSHIDLPKEYYVVTLP